MKKMCSFRGGPVSHLSRAFCSRTARVRRFGCFPKNTFRSHFFSSAIWARSLSKLPSWRQLGIGGRGDVPSHEPGRDAHSVRGKLVGTAHQIGQTLSRASLAAHVRGSRTAPSSTASCSLTAPHSSLSCTRPRTRHVVARRFPRARRPGARRASREISHGPARHCRQTRDGRGARQGRRRPRRASPD